MTQAPMVNSIRNDQDQRISDVIRRERARLRSFIRKRVPDRLDAEDILQEVFYELIAAYRMMKPIENVGAWLYRVARNRITDLFRAKKSAPESNPMAVAETGETISWEDLLPDPGDGPEAAYARGVVLEEIVEALNELPSEQREVFIAHEIEGLSFKDMAATTGVPINTLLSRKRYAVLHLRRRLEAIHDEFSKGRR
jgi:RNA polymerase sigma factor (sigma-70 family)